MNKVNIAILGLGTVGGGSYQIIQSNGADIAKNYGIELTVKRVLDRSADKQQEYNLPEGMLTDNFDDILLDDTISIVVETIGGVGVAKDFVIKSLLAGKTVVTANKELVAKHRFELEQSAKKGKAGLFFEASCMGGVPVIRVLTESMQANKIKRIIGIFNGTTNYILSKMTEEGWSYASALSEAQRLGYAEQDPTNDVEGFDTAYKLSILGSMAFNTPIPYNEVMHEGITKIGAEDIASARGLGYVIKLLAVGIKDGKKVSARVYPAFVRADHPLASVSGSFNAVHLEGDFVGDIMLYGKGAGAYPTGSAIVSDVVKASSVKHHKNAYKWGEGKERGIKINGDYSTSFFFRIEAEDKAGILAKVTAILASNNISICQMEQLVASEGMAQIVFSTHKTKETDMLKAIDKIRSLDCVKCVCSLIRVVD